MAGTAFGTALALAIGAITSLRAQGFGPGPERFPRSPGGFPGGPRPFPGGPGPARHRAKREDGEGRKTPPPPLSPDEGASIRAEADLVAAEAARSVREARQDDIRVAEAAAAEGHLATPDAQPAFAAQDPASAWLPPLWHPAHGMTPTWPVPYGYHPAATGAGPYQAPYAWPPAAPASFHPRQGWPGSVQPGASPPPVFRPVETANPDVRPTHAKEEPAEGELARIREDMRRLRTRIGRHAFRRPA